MNPADGLLRRCIAAMIPEPVWFVFGADGLCHWPADEMKPLRTVIDVRGGLAILPGVDITTAPGVKVRLGNGEIMIECDGEAVIYERVGTTLTGAWVCTRQVDGNGR